MVNNIYLIKKRGYFISKMVSRKTIETIINKIIQKKEIKVKHGYFGVEIRKTLHQITDDENEYNILRKAIFDFYEKYNTEKRKEYLEVMDYNNNTHKIKGENYTHEVDWTQEMTDIALNEGMLYSIHNHPMTTSVQSWNDLDILLKGNVKYGITLSNDGLMIIKNNNEFLTISNQSWSNNIWWATYVGYNKFIDEEFNNCKEKYSNEYNSISQRLNDNKITQETADEEWDSVFREYSKTNSRKYVQNYKTKIENDDTNLIVQYIPKTPKKK